MKRTSSDCHVSWISRVWVQPAVVCVAGCALWFTVAVSFGQPPGTYPPADVVRPNSENPTESDRLPIKGFLFLDDSQNPVLVPGMTYERFYELDSESDRQTRRHIFDEVKINGRIEGARAEMMVEVELNLDSTGGETVSIPLGMENFHRISPPEFLVGSAENRTLAVSIDEQSGGYVLLASTEERIKIAFRMRMSARVETGSGSSLEFSLPSAPASVTLTSDVRGAKGEIVNRDDEIVSTREDASGRSEFVVESGGGRFTLRWGTLERTVSVPLLEADTKMTMRWNSPQDEPIQRVQMVVRDLRESIDRFSLKIPDDTVLLDAPTLASNGQAVELIQPDTGNPQLYDVLIPKDERRQRIDLNLNLHLTSKKTPSASNELPVRVPEIVGALRHQGTVEIQTGNDHRLRWRERPYVYNVTQADGDDSSTDTKNYTFRFSRGSFTLPVWMGATQRQLRVTSHCDLELHDSYVNLVMEISMAGTSNGSRMLTVDLADWQLTGSSLRWDEGSRVIEIEANTGIEETAPIQIRARKAVDPMAASGATPAELSWSIPRVITSNDSRAPMTIQESSVSLTGIGRASLVVDLEASSNIERVVEDLSPSNQRLRRFQVMPPDSQAMISGALIEEPPRLLLDESVQVTLADGVLDTVVDWTIESQIDLRGRLRVAVPEAEAWDASSAWSITVDGSRAILLPTDEADLDDVNTIDQLNATLDALTTTDSSDVRFRTYELISDYLSGGGVRIRFARSTPIDPGDETKEVAETVLLPRPLAEEITLQNEVTVNFVGDPGHSIIAADLNSTDTVLLKVVPSVMPIRIVPRTTPKGELIIDRVLVRSAISETAQHDEVIASLLGNGDFEMELVDGQHTEIQVTLNETSAEFQVIDNQLVVPVSGDEKRHTIVVRLWNDLDRNGFSSEVRPLAWMRSAATRLYWNLTVPKDRHLVWASPSAGRPMHWVFEDWGMRRKPLYTERTLISRVAPVDPSPMPRDGNRYLFTAMDGRSFRAQTASQTLLWLIVAGAVVLVSSALTYLPTTRNPGTLAIGIVGLAGILCVAPDAAIIVGQISISALVLVVVMLAIRNLIRPLPARVLMNTRADRRDPSTRIVQSKGEGSAAGSASFVTPTPVETVAHPSDEVAS